MRLKPAKPRIALFGVGIMGGGPLGQGTPVLTDLFQRLTEHYEIVYYTTSNVIAANVPAQISLRQPIRMRIPGSLKYLLILWRALQDHRHKRFSIIFSVSVYPSGLLALMLARITRKPLVLQLIATEAVRFEDLSVGNLKSNWMKKITRRVCEKADVLVTVADYQKKLALRDLERKPEIKVLPLRVDPRNFIYRKRELTKPVQFIQVAFYSKIKDQDTMFKAFSIVAKAMECHLTVVGDGFETQAVRTMLANLGIENKVTLTGFRTQQELAKHFDEAHILLHTAIFETGCAVIQEAFASGVAVCGTNVGLLHDIGGEYAVIVPPQNPEMLADEMIKLVNDPERFERITRSAFKWITENDARWSYNNYLELFDKIDK